MFSIPQKYVWHFTPGTVGGAFALMDYGVHWFDLAEFVTGDRIHEVTANFHTRRPQRLWTGEAGQGPRPSGKALEGGHVAVEVSLEDQADLLVNFKSGASGVATIMALSPGNPNHLSLSFDGDEGRFRLAGRNSPTVSLSAGLARNASATANPDRLHADDRFSAMVPAGHPEGYLDAFRNVIAESWRAMRGETVLYPTFEDGARGIAIVESAVESAKSRRPVVTRPI